MVRRGPVSLRFILLASACLCSVNGRAGTATDLLADRASWSSWAARPELAPQAAAEPGGGPGGRPVLTLSGRGKDDVCGCWRRPLPALQKGRRYRIEAAYQAEKVALPGQSVWALLTQGESEFLELSFRGTRAGRRRMALELSPDRDWNGLELRLYLAWSPDGVVRWSDVSLTDVTDRPVETPTARLAAVSGRPKDPATPAECLDYYCARLDEVGARGVDLVCLPEVINIDGIAGDRSRWAEPIPGPSTARLAEKARKYATYVAASLLERDGDRRYNTGILLDRSGNLVGKYRKTHPTIGEAFLKGITPGADYPVFETDFGRVGYMICYDYHFPEVARILSLKGAQIVVHSNMADNREGGTLWDACVRIRAVDNNVHLVTAGNDGRSGVINPRGEILARTEKRQGGIALAECDLGLSVRNHSGRGIGERYLQVRHAETFRPLTQSYVDFREGGDRPADRGPTPGR